MKNIKSFLTMVFISLLAWSPSACVARKTPSPTLEASATPAATNTPVPTPAQAPTQTNGQSEYLSIFETVWQTVNDKYFDPTFGGLDWSVTRERYLPLIAAARDDKTFYEAINRMLFELNVSHIYVVPPAAYTL